MKNLLFIFLVLTISNCTNDSTPTTSSLPNTNTNNNTNKVIQTVDNIEDAIMYIEAYQGEAKDMKLGLVDPMFYGGKKLTRGYAVQVIEKTVSKTKGWRFDGYEKKGDVHFYTFKKK